MHPESRLLTHILKPSGSCCLGLFIVKVLHFIMINYAVSVYMYACMYVHIYVYIYIYIYIYIHINIYTRMCVKR